MFVIVIYHMETCMQKNEDTNYMYSCRITDMQKQIHELNDTN